jgi:hypothetical protein
VVGLAREWDRDKILARDRGRRAGKRERSHEPEEEEEETRRPASTKSLEELFNKTRATPAVYWKPLSSVSNIWLRFRPDNGYFWSNRIQKSPFFKIQFHLIIIETGFYPLWIRNDFFRIRSRIRLFREFRIRSRIRLRIRILYVF